MTPDGFEPCDCTETPLEGEHLHRKRAPDVSSQWVRGVLEDIRKMAEDTHYSRDRRVGMMSHYASLKLAELAQFSEPV